VRSTDDLFAHPFTFFLSSSKVALILSAAVSALLSLLMPAFLASILASLLAGILLARLQERILRRLHCKPAWIRYLLASLGISVLVALCVQLASLLTFFLFGWFWSLVGDGVFYLLQYRLFKRYVLRRAVDPSNLQ